MAVLSYTLGVGGAAEDSFELFSNDRKRGNFSISVELTERRDRAADDAGLDVGSTGEFDDISLSTLGICDVSIEGDIDKDALAWWDFQPGRDALGAFLERKSFEALEGGRCCAVPRPQLTERVTPESLDKPPSSLLFVSSFLERLFSSSYPSDAARVIKVPEWLEPESLSGLLRHASDPKCSKGIVKANDI